MRLLRGWRPPQPRCVDPGAALQLRRAAGSDGDRLRWNACDRLAAGLVAGIVEQIDRCAHLRLGSAAGGIIQGDGQLHLRCIGRDVRRGQLRAPVRDMQRRRLGQPHVAIQPAARIPARRLGRVIQPNDQLIALACNRIRRQVHAPGAVAVRPTADEVAVEPDRGVGHRTVEIQKQRAAAIAGRDVQALAIPADAPARQPAHATVRPVCQERPGNGPVVRQVHGFPRAVVEVRLHIRHRAARVAWGGVCGVEPGLRSSRWRWAGSTA